MVPTPSLLTLTEKKPSPFPVVLLALYPRRMAHEEVFPELFVLRPSNDMLPPVFTA